MDLPYKPPEQMLPYGTFKEIPAAKAPGEYPVTPGLEHK